VSEWTARPATRPCVWRVESPFETLRPALRPTHAARSRALSAPSTAVACGRPRRGAVAALVPRWSHDNDHLPGGRVTRALPPPAKGHGRGAWYKRRNRTAGGRWGPHLPGQPASRLHPHALVRAAFDNTGSDRHGLWVRHADTHAQPNTPGARGLTVRRSPSIGRAEARATDATRGDSTAARGDSTAARGESTAARGESASREWRVGEFQGANRRYTGSTRPVEWPHGESTRRGAAVHSVRRGARGGGRLAGASRPPPVPVPPPLPLRALPIAVYLVGAWSCIGQVSSCMPLVPSCAQYSIHAAVSTFLDTARYISIHGQSEFPPQRLLLCVCIDTGSNRAAQTCTEFLQQRNSWFVQQFNGVGGGGILDTHGGADVRDRDRQTDVHTFE